MTKGGEGGSQRKPECGDKEGRDNFLCRDSSAG